MTDVLIKRELLEGLAAYMRQRVCPAPSGKVATELHADLTAALDAPRQTASAPHKHEAQPEVAQNTGSRSMTNKLSSQGRTGCTGVEGVAAPCETPDAVDIFAWATFDGEGSHDLRLYEDNENYRDDFRAANPALHPDWVFPLCRLSDAQRAISELREVNRIQLEIAEVHGAACVEIRKERDTLRQQLAEARDEICQHSNDLTIAYMAGAADMKKQRDKLAGLLRELYEAVGEFAWDSDLEQRIDAALAEVKPCPESLHPAAT